MRRKSSSSADEDNEGSFPDPSKLSHDEKKKTFTTAKYDLTRYSETLDRRKIEKAVRPTPSASDTWTSPTKPQSSPKKVEASGPDQAGNKMLGARARRRLRRQSPWSCSLLTLTATLSALLLIIFILHSFVTRQLDSKGCDMYYTRSMFFNFADFDTEHTRFASKYSLHLYREVGFDEDPKVCAVLPKHSTGG